MPTLKQHLAALSHLVDLSRLEELRHIGIEGGEAGTLLTYTAQAQVGGKLAQIGSRLVDSAAAKMADDFFARFVERFETEVQVSEPVQVTEAAPQPWWRPLGLSSLYNKLAALWSGRGKERNT